MVLVSPVPSQGRISPEIDPMPEQVPTFLAKCEAIYLNRRGGNSISAIVTMNEYILPRVKPEIRANGSFVELLPSAGERCVALSLRAPHGYVQRVKYLI